MNKSAIGSVWDATRRATCDGGAHPDDLGPDVCCARRDVYGAGVVAERTRWGAVASRRHAFWKLAFVGGVVTSTVFVVAGSAPSGAAVRLSLQGAIAPALDSDGVFWLATAWMAITALLALPAGHAWRLGICHVHVFVLGVAWGKRPQ